MTQQARRGNAGYRRDDADIHPPYLYPDYVSTRLRAPNKPRQHRWPRTKSDKLSRSDSGVGGWHQFNRAVEKKNQTIGGSNGS